MKWRLRVSALGLILAGAYVIPSAVLVIYGSSLEDTKGHFVLMQLPIAFQMAIVDSFHLTPKLSGVSWTGAYLLFGLPIVVLLYLVGWGLSRQFD
jgi:hypothetical protein